jgi:hypothetical protein
MAAVKMRSIKIRGDMIDTRKLRRAIDNALDGAAKAVKIDLSVTTQTWRNRPTFTIEKDGDSRTVATDDEVYGYVDEGTEPHLIVAKSPNKPLTFGIGGRPKTAPKVIGSRPGARGSTIVRAQVVHHPGTTAREFTDTTKEKMDDRLPDLLQRAIDSTV